MDELFSLGFATAHTDGGFLDISRSTIVLAVEVTVICFTVIGVLG